MYVHAPDQHLSAPPLGALDQLGVPRRVGELLCRPLRERVGARAEQLHPAAVYRRAHRGQGGAQIGHRVAGVLADTGDDLNGVAQQFLVHMRAFADLGDDGRGLVAQIAGDGIDERELPFDADGRPV